MSKETDEKRHVGAPPKMKGGKRRFPYLDDVTVAAATRLGNGNLSEGLRLAVEPHIRDEDYSIPGSESTIV